MKKKFLTKVYLIIMICFMFIMNSYSSFAKTTATKHNFPDNVISYDKCVMTYDNKDKALVLLIKNAIMKNGNKKNLKVKYDPKGKMTMLKSKKSVFVDGKTIIKDGSKIYKSKIKGTSLMLSVYSGGKNLGASKYDLKKFVTKYKKMKLVQIMKISKNKIRVLYGNIDRNGSGNSGGTVILNMKTGVVKKEAKYLFWPTSIDKKYVFSSTGGTILKTKLKSSKKTDLYQKPKGDNNYNLDCYSYKNGILAYANSNGVYILKKNNKNWLQICDFSKKQQFVSNIMIIDQKQIFVQISSEEDGMLGELLQLRF